MRHLVVDGRGPPFILTLTEANCNDRRILAATFNGVPIVPTGQRGCPWRRPTVLPARRAPTSLPLARVSRPQRHALEHSTGHREQPIPPRPTLDRRTHVGLARPLPSPHHPLRETRRPPPRLPNACLCSHLQGTAQTVLSLTLRSCASPKLPATASPSKPLTGLNRLRTPYRCPFRLCQGTQAADGPWPET